MTAPAAVGLVARARVVESGPTSLSLLGHAIAVWILTALAVIELVTDQSPTTPSRTVPVQSGARLVMRGLAGAAVGAARGTLVAGFVAGFAGAVIGTLVGRAFRARLGAALGNDHPAAFVEDAVAIAGAFLIMKMLA